MESERETKMTTATGLMRDYSPDRRRVQINAIIAFVMDAIGKHIPDDGHSRKHAVYDLQDALARAGVEIITEQERLNAGLPPRNERGWTQEELRILDARIMKAMLEPAPSMYTFPQKTMGEITG